ncbi:rabenosyn-5-like isoform X3 [Carassius gibelio]|uniref:rabenosyn-5-like isoform X3 n=1 Tax=Carassius gibelio TaxID=101364 RepID=UPI00227895EC|nr:rabenosyn-5-like isoform X3 [Carassius gibelio]
MGIFKYLRQLFSNLSWSTPSPEHFVCLPHLSHLIQLISSLLETARPEVGVSVHGELTSFDRTNMDAAQIRSLEKSVVSWVNDQDVPFCPDCGGKFNIRNRRHHCRLCGSIMCRKCTEFIPLPLAYKLTSGTREAVWAPGQSGSPGSADPVTQQTSRRGSINSISSVTSVLEEKDEDRVRCCHHCMEALLRQQHKLEEKDHVPDIVKLYERLRTCMEKVEAKAPEYTRMAESLNAGETTCNLESAAALRMEIQKYYELIDVLSKKILTLGLKDEVQPHPKALQLQRMVRYTATLFIQEKLLGLTSLPTKEKYEELKKKRREEQEKKAQQERLAGLEAQKRRMENDHDRVALGANENVSGPRITKAGGWLPQSDTLHTHSELDDPLLQQIKNIESFLRQTRFANRTDEVAMLEENLRQLQDEFDAQQTSRAMQLSQRLQQKQIEHLQQRELENRNQSKNPTLDFRERENVLKREEVEGDFEDTGLPIKSSPKALSLLLGNSPPLERLRDKHTPTPPTRNPFDEEHISPDKEEPTNSQTANGRKVYNPFEEENDEVEDTDTAKVKSPRNPFEDEDYEDGGNPFKEASDEIPAASTNPFDEEVDEDGTAVDDMIEEELLLQQIDNIRSYIFDAKLNGHSDKVELLSENLKELQQTLQEQKIKNSGHHKLVL